MAPKGTQQPCKGAAKSGRHYSANLQLIDLIHIMDVLLVPAERGIVPVRFVRNSKSFVFEETKV